MAPDLAFVGNLDHSTVYCFKKQQPLRRIIDGYLKVVVEIATLTPQRVISQMSRARHDGLYRI
jgi:hypothetical protein